MIHLSQAQLLGLWSDLCDAYHGRSSYGGDTAELYAYRFMAYSPMAHTGHDTQTGIEARVKLEAQAARTLYRLLCLFAHERKCAIEVNGRALGPWLRKEPFGHRVHVKVLT